MRVMPLYRGVRCATIVLVGVRYYIATFALELRPPDHACGPDCICWQRKKSK